MGHVIRPARPSRARGGAGSGARGGRGEQSGELGDVGAGLFRIGRAPGLLAFLDAIIEVVSRNKSLMAELAYSAASLPAAGDETGEEPGNHPVYRFWHGHISALNQLATEGPERLSSAMRAVACAVLDAPAPGRADPGDAGSESAESAG